MKTIGITQRVDTTSTGERRDALDQRWCALMESLGVRLIPLPNLLLNPGAYVGDLGVDGLVLSGGNDIADVPGAKDAAAERDRVERALIDYASQKQLPLLGVCRGAQMLAHYYGTPLVPVSGHVAIRHSVQPSGADFPPDPFEVNSYHNFGIAPKSLASALIASACDVRGWVEAFRHKERPQVGILWHPEREDVWAAHDLSLLRRLFAL